jgi:hypothetical protein
MEIKNLYDPSVKQGIIDRIHKLTAQTQRQWEKWMLHKCWHMFRSQYMLLLVKGS